MRAQKILRSCILILLVSLFSLLKPVSTDSFPPALFPLDGGVSIGLAQEGEAENVVFQGEAVSESSNVVEGTELLEQRTLTSKTYQVGPDEYKAVISSLPMHFVNEDGNWEEIDTTIQRQADGSYYSGANLVKAKFPARLGAEESISLEIPLFQSPGSNSARFELVSPMGPATATDSQEISVRWQPIRMSVSTGDGLEIQPVASADVAPAMATAHENTVLYGEAYPGIAEEFVVMPGGVKHSLILSGLPDFVPANPPPDAFLDYTVEMSLLPGISLYVDGVELRRDYSTSSPIELRRGEMEIVGYLLAPYAYEQDNPRKYMSATQQIQFMSDRIIITVRTPLSWLAAPDRNYPVVIDPTTNAYPWQDTFMSSAHPTTNYGGWPSMYVGYDTVYGYGNERILVHWNVRSIPASSNISSASIGLYQTGAQGNTSCFLGLYRMLSSWSSSYATWNNRTYGTPWSSPGASGTESDYYFSGYGFTFSNTNNAWKVLTTAGIGTDWVRRWIDGTYSNYGVMLKPPANPTSYDCERTFRTWNYSGWAYAPYLTVTYTYTGGAPTTLYHNSAQTHTYPNPEHYYREATDYTSYWRGTALRPLEQSNFDLWLHTASDFSAWKVGSSYGVGRTDYTLTRKYVTTTGYPRVVQEFGTDNYNIHYMHRYAQLNPPSSGVGTLPPNTLWLVFEVYISQPGTYEVIVTPGSGDPDFGVAIHAPTGDYHTRSSALAFSDQVGQNLTEQFKFTASAGGYYGLVVWSNVRTGVTQQFQLQVQEFQEAPSYVLYLPISLKNYMPKQGPFSNGGFEDSSRWSLSGELRHERTTAQHRSGSYSLLLGEEGSSPCKNNVPCSPGGSENCESFGIATQSFDVPSTGSPSLNFYYRIYTYDKKPSDPTKKADYFAAYILDPSTSTETLIHQDDLGWVTGWTNYACDNPVKQRDTYWSTPVPTIDLSPYKGKTINLIFRVANGGDRWYNTWVYVDDVTCSGC